MSRLAAGQSPTHAPVAERHDSARFAAFGVLRERDFRLLFAGMTVSSLAMPMQWVVQMWLVLDLTGGTQAALWLGVSGFVRGLPMLLLSLHGGALADRMDRRRLLALTQVASIAVALIFVVLIATDLLTIWLYLPLVLLSSAVMSFDQPARQALVPDLVPPERVTHAITLNSMAMFSSMAVGPALAGFAIRYAGAGGAYLLIAASYLGVLTAVILMRTRPQAARPATGHRSARAEIAEGLAYVRSQPAILWLISITFAMTVLGMAFTNIAPLVITEVLGGDATSLGWVFTAWGIGAIAGSFVLAGWLDQIRSKGAVVLVMSALFVAGLIGFAYAKTIPMAALFQFLPGVANTTIMVISNAVILANTPPLLRGRVMGIYYMNRGLMPIGALCAAILGEAVGVQAGIALLALASGLAVILVTLAQRGAWRHLHTSPVSV